MKSIASKPVLVLAVITCVLVAWACGLYILRDREQEEARRQGAAAMTKLWQQTQQSMLNQSRNSGF